MLGHVNNVTYLDYLQEARVDLFRTHAPDRGADELAEGVVVVRHEVTYTASLTFRFEPIRIECWVTEIRAAAFTVAYEIFETDASGNRVVYLRANTLLAPYVLAEQRPRRLRAEEVVVLERLLEPGDPLRPTVLGEPTLTEGGEYGIQVRFSDLDVYGHVNNVLYLEYFQEARIQLLARARAKGGQDTLSLVVAQTDVDYKRPILLRPEPYLCRTWVSRVGNTSLTFDSLILDGAQVLASARVVGVCLDSATGRPTPVPAGLRPPREP